MPARGASKTLFIHYGRSGHVKWLVDVMTGFGVKGPQWREVITSNFTYSNASDIHQFVTNKFRVIKNITLVLKVRKSNTREKIKFKDQM